MESAASGPPRGRRAPPSARAGEEPVAFPEDTALGALGRYIARSDPAALPAHQHRLRPAARSWRSASATRRAGGWPWPSGPWPAWSEFQRPPGRARVRAVAAPRRLAGLTCRRRSPPSSATSTASATPRRTPSAPTAKTSSSSPATCARSWAATAGPRDVDHLLIRAFLARLRRQGLKTSPPPGSWPPCAPSSAISAAKACSTATRRGRSSPRGWKSGCPPTWTSGTSRSSSRCRGTAPPRSGAGPSSRCCTRPASAARSWWGSTSRRSTARDA